jgi:hypothetical protein
VAKRGVDLSWDRVNVVIVNIVFFIVTAMWQTFRSTPNVGVINLAYGNELHRVNHYLDEIVPKYTSLNIVEYNANVRNTIRTSAPAIIDTCLTAKRRLTGDSRMLLCCDEPQVSEHRPLQDSEASLPRVHLGMQGECKNVIPVLGGQPLSFLRIPKNPWQAVPSQVISIIGTRSSVGVQQDRRV